MLGNSHTLTSVLDLVSRNASLYTSKAEFNFFSMNKSCWSFSSRVFTAIRLAFSKSSCVIVASISPSPSSASSSATALSSGGGASKLNGRRRADFDCGRSLIESSEMDRSSPPWPVRVELDELISGVGSESNREPPAGTWKSDISKESIACRAVTVVVRRERRLTCPIAIQEQTRVAPNSRSRGDVRSTLTVGWRRCGHNDGRWGYDQFSSSCQQEYVRR